MSLAWLEELLPQAMVSPRTQIWWFLFLVLFPLAYVGGGMLERAEEAPARMAEYEDRAASIKRAASFAETKGFSLAGWHQYAVVEDNKDLLSYYQNQGDPTVAALSVLTPAREVQVLFRSPDQSHEFRVYLSLSGVLTGYDFGKSTERNRKINSDLGVVQINTTTTHTDDDNTGSMRDAITPSDGEAEGIARKALAGNADLSKLVQLGKPTVSSDGDDAARRDVTWDANPGGKKEVTLHVSVGVRDSQVVAERVEASVDKAHEAKGRKLPAFLESVYGFFLTFCAFYALYRYAKRTLQKEVSHVRTLVVAALFAVSYSVLAYSLAYDQVAVRVSGATFEKIGTLTYVATGLVLAAMGLLVGVAYGSGEGELREAYPGKLNSLDALLAGRIFSRDVGASLLWGAAAAGWLFLADRGVTHFLPSNMSDSRSDVLSVTFARIPWLTLLVGRQYDALLVAVAGLLLPAAFLARRGAKRKRRFVWLIAFAVLSVLNDVAKYPTAATSLVALIIRVGALLLPFFAFDLLAAMVSLSALSFVIELTRLGAVFPSWSALADGLTLLGAVGLAGATYLALRGRRVREEEVRPRYAKNLAERMSLQAEVLAAREAQLRLLPQAAPEMAGVQFAACCLPAHGVGGDFYDFYELDAHRVGIFVAQGGDQGLASALCIALTKGVLMHASLRPHTPTQMILELEASIAELLESGSGSGISFAYGVMDTRRNVLSYARIGESPRFVGYRAGLGLTTSSQLERVVMAAERPRGAAPIYEGSAQARLGDYLIFFTNGVTAMRVRRFGRREYQWVELLMRDLTKPEELQTSLLAALEKHQSRAVDDLTAVVMRVVATTAISQEVVA